MLNQGRKYPICATISLLLALSLSACSGAASSPAAAPQATPELGPAVEQTPAPAVGSTSPAETGSAPASSDGIRSNGKLLTVPESYRELLQIETAEDGDTRYLFSVREKASMEAGEKQHPGEDWGEGWLFAIGAVTEDELHEMLCYDLSGADLFARENNLYYFFYHPTDVRFTRENYEGMGDPSNPDWQQWAMLSSWSWTVPDTFLADNPGLTPEKRSNTTLDILLARMAYMDDAIEYTLSSTAFGPLAPGDVDPAPYIDRLMNGVVYEYVEEEAPDGEYYVLSMPDEDVRFDFFTADGKTNYVREVYGDNFATLYRAKFADGISEASRIVGEWYDALARVRAAG